MSRRKNRASPIVKTVMPDGTVLFSSPPTLLADVPLEYQASLYAKKERERTVKNDAKKKKKLDDLKTQLKVMKEELRNATIASKQAELVNQIAALEKTIKKVPKPRRKWSPVLPGSFGSKGS
ncbi:hypothetical protein [Chromobacterium subtsugae]|uniref:hypothetical protein n=1 Tax=Chromobacterium subtsugae TaxID=251747 RepID=UPI000A50BFD8|nr:hypothetical protein [Chromobacterium subtsugae]